MNRSDLLTDELIQAAFERRARRADPHDLRDEILAVTAATGQRAAWRGRLAYAFASPALHPAWTALLVLAALLGIALVIALVGQRPQTPLRTGLLAYSREGDVYLANADGSAAIRVAHDDGVSFSAPTWSPDARWLAFQGGDGVFLFNPATLEIERVATAGGAVWSSDSRSLAFVVYTPGTTGVIEVADIESGLLRDIEPMLDTGASIDAPLLWSPDGRWFLARVNASGSRLVRIDALTGDSVDIAPMHHLADPGAHWSSDSRYFAFARTDACDDPPCRSSVVVEDAELSSALAVSDPASIASNPIWSPDDAWIAFTSHKPGEQVATVSIVRPDGRDLRALAQIPILNAGLSWSADGSALDFMTADPGLGVAGALSEVRISDGVVRQVTVGDGVDGYDWQAIDPGRPDPALPIAAPSFSGAPKSIAPLPAPPDAPPADPSGQWSGLAVDARCDAGILDLGARTFRAVGSRCPDSIGDVVFGPGGAAYAVAGIDGRVDVVGSDDSTLNVLGPLGTPSAGTIVESQLAWSADGRWISVSRCSAGPGADCLDREDVVVSADGRSLEKLPETPSWSTDSRRLAVEGENGDLLVGSPDGSELRSIGKIPVPISWSPNATQFAFIRDGDAWIVNADGTGQRNATNFASGGVFGAVWSPDRRFIAVTQESQLWIISLDQGDLLPIDLGPGRASIYRLLWSPDGARLAVSVGPGETPATVIVRTDDWTATAMRGTGIDDVAWSPDGRFIAFLDTSRNPGQIDVANNDGSGRHTIWTGSDASSRLTWVP